MSNTVLSDDGKYRAMTIEEADKVFAEIAILEVDLAKEAAIKELRVKKLQSEHQAKVAGKVEKRLKLAKQLNGFINAHKDLFQKPRARKLAQGSYGLRMGAGKLEIEDVEAIIAFSDENNLPLYKVEKILDKDAIKEHLSSAPEGEEPLEIPGASYEKGEKIFYKVDKSLIDEAKLKVQE